MRIIVQTQIISCKVSSSLKESWNEFFHYMHSKEFLENMSEFSNVAINKLKYFSFIKNGKR